MKRRNDRRGRPVAALILATLAGCGGRTSTGETPLPDAELARRAVDVAMASWAQGGPTGAIVGSGPRVQVIDSFRKPGQAVASYRVLGISTGETALTASVRVSLTGPDEESTVRFHLLGTDPVLLFRSEDYELMSHWEHKMDPPPEEASP